MKNKETKTNKMKKAWPTKKAMEQVYEMNLWGDNDTAFYSGEGSHQLEIVQPYLEVLISFLSSFKTPLVVCDLGCGDFNVGKQLVKFTKNFIAVDIVEDLISFNKNTFKNESVEFHCLDIAKDELPVGDCAIIRQVLQHLSNAEVKSIVSKLAQYKYVIVTEHLPEGDFEANKDIISGQGIRLKKQSGINLLEPPFNLEVQEEKQLLSHSLKHHKGVIVTTLYQMF